LSQLIIQIYEIQNPEEAEAVVAAGADHVGSVLLSQAEWKIAELKDTVDRVRRCGAKSSLIPLFRDESCLVRALDHYRPEIVHFCDALPLSPLESKTCQQLIELQIRVKEHFPELAVMRSIPIAPEGLADQVPTLELGQVFEPFTDYFLTDTLLLGNAGSSMELQPVDGFVGITGRPCDWEMAGRLVRQSKIPVILAGGISADNATEAIARVRPAGIDSCTLTNARDAQDRPVRFQKDLDKVRALVAAARRAESFY
jgi:phosphoribosylanthranilate isomerase